MNKKNQRVVMVSLIGLLISLSGCNDSHAVKKQAMVEHWEKSSAQAQLPAIENLLERGEIEEAKKELAHCLEVDPEQPRVYMLVGRVHFIEARNKQAREAFEHAVELDPQLDQAWHFLGSLAVIEKDYPQALAHFEKAHELMPAKIEYILSLSDVYMETGQFDRATQVVDRALDRDPQNLELLLSKAQIYQQTDQPDEAIRTYEQAQLIHGDEPQILEPLGYTYIAQKQWSKAAEIFDPLVAQYKNDPARYNITMRSLATCLFQSGQYGQSLFWYDKLSLVYRDDADVWLNMAHAALGVNDPKRASYCAISALKVRPSWNKAYVVLGSANYMRGLYQQSLEAFYKVCDDEEMSAFAWFMTGRCYQQLGQSRQANAAFERAEELDPNNELIATFLKKTIHPL